MVFSSTVFLFLFLPIVLLGYYNPWFKSQRFKNVFLLLASLGFYAWGEPVFVFLMIASIIVTWIIGLLIGKNEERKKVILTIAITYHVTILFLFKYLGFFVQQVGLLMFHEDVDLGIELPIGISFFTFQMMSYLFDVYYKKASVQKNVFNLALYISLFPQLIAGPIVRYNQIETEITYRQVTFDNFSIGMKRFIYGLAKKVLIANYVAQIADNTFDYLGEKTVAMAWLGAVCYTLQIYFDFSGYSDMAIGLGRMFGFNFSENFNYPYISRSITEFWRRWHISLSSWFKDYVYIPLGGNRKGERRQILNLFIVWILTGIWHGANWTFLVWGLLYFVVLICEKYFLKHSYSEKQSAFKSVLSWIYTMLIVNFAWVIFRSENILASVNYLGNMVGIGADGFYNAAVSEYIGATALVLIIAIIDATPLYRKLITVVEQKKMAWIESIWILVIFALSVLQLISSTYNPFIYFNF